jgi:hypothetical protein
MIRSAAASLALLLGAPLWGLQDKKDDAVPDAALQGKIDEAIRRGVDFLKTADSIVAWEAFGGNSDELILWTLVHADVSTRDPVYQTLLQRMLAAKLERTYKVALQAMILEEVDRVAHQARIWQCGQFLIDNQCANGQWSYGEESLAVQNLPTAAKTVDIATAPVSGVRDFSAAAPGKRQKPKVVRKLAVQKTKSGPSSGDNSNSQYAALGLRACFEAGIKFPRETLALTRKWWLECQHGADKDKKVATGKLAADPRGWCYDVKDGHPAYGSMTAGAVASVAILDYLLEIDWKKDPSVSSGLAWLTQHFSVTENVGPPQERPAGTAEFYYYYLYGLERAGILAGTETLGAHPWYIEGAKVLVEAQAQDGSWQHGGEWNKPVWNTCFAILFLKRATRPLVASVDR